MVNGLCAIPLLGAFDSCAHQHELTIILWFLWKLMILFFYAISILKVHFKHVASFLKVGGGATDPKNLDQKKRGGGFTTSPKPYSVSGSGVLNLKLQFSILIIISFLFLPFFTCYHKSGEGTGSGSKDGLIPRYIIKFCVLLVYW